MASPEESFKPRIVFSATLSDFTLHLHKVHWMINTHEETSVILSLSHPPTACPAGGPSTLTQAAHLICYHYSVTGLKKKCKPSKQSLVCTTLPPSLRADVTLKLRRLSRGFWRVFVEMFLCLAHPD